MKRFSIFIVLFFLVFNPFISVKGQYYRDWYKYCPSPVSNGFYSFRSAVDNGGNNYLAVDTYIGCCPNHGGTFLSKYDSLGSVIWSRCDTMEQLGALGISPTGFLYLATKINAPTASMNFHALILRKLDKDGNVLWQNFDTVSYNSSSYTTHFNFMDFDHSGNIILSGVFSPGSPMYAQTSKYDTLGNLTWRKQLTQSYATNGRCIKIDNADNIYVSILDGVVKYDANGNELWHIPLNYMNLAGLYMNSQNNIYTTGIRQNPHIIGVSKLDLNGNLLWERNYGLPNSYAVSIVSDTDSNIYVAGAAHLTNTYGAVSNGVLLKYTSTGDLIWVKNFTGSASLTSNNSDNSLSIIPYKENKFLLMGALLNNSSLADGFLCVVDTSGTILWQDIFDSNVSGRRCERFESIGLDRDSNIYIIGEHGNDTGSNLVDLLMIKYKKGFGKSSPSIQGNLFFDANQNCILNSSEYKLEGKLVSLVDSNSTLVDYAMTDTSGSFWFYAPTGHYHIQPIPPQYWLSTCSNGLDIDLNNSADSSYDNKIGLYMLPGIQDLRVSIAGNAFRPGQNTNYSIVFGNTGTVAKNGTIEITHDPLLHFISASTSPDFILNNKLVWNYVNLQPGQNRQISFTLNADTSLNLMSIVQKLYGKIEPVFSDQTPYNNIDSASAYVSSPFDPNFKSVNLKDAIFQNDSVLSYIIHFQNLGNDTAFNVVLKDSISSFLELNTLEMGASSHYNTVSLTNNHMTIRFNNISLPPKSVNEINSQGFIKYSIHRKQNINIGTKITNTAAIYFDYMPPVITNTTCNVYSEILTSIGKTISQNNAIKIYPNPASNTLNVEGISTKSKIYLYDTVGKLIKTEESKETVSLQISQFNDGIYILVVENELGRSFHKVIISK